MNLASRAISRVTNGPGINTEPFWGKDGSTIYFTSDRGGKPQIYKTSASGGGAERVTFVGHYNANPKLSADEKPLVMIHRQDGFPNLKVAAQDLQRGSVKIRTDSTLEESPPVAPNGHMVNEWTHGWAVKSVEERG